MIRLSQNQMNFLRSVLLAWSVAFPILSRPASALAAETSPPASSGYFIRNWGVPEGMPEASVLSLLQTRDGYIWAGTWNGLARFNGNRFRSFTAERTEGMATDFGKSLCEGRDGSVWMGSDGIVTRFREGRFESFGRDAGLSTGYALKITEDVEGTVWVAFDHALYRRRGERFEQFPYDSERGGNLRELIPDRAGGLWVASNNGLWRLKNEMLETVSATSGWAIRALAMDKEQRLWIGAKGRGIAALQNGVLKVLPGTDRYEVDSLCAARNGDVWASTTSGLLVRWRAGQFLELNRQSGLVGIIVQALLEDSDGNIWAGSEGGGLMQLREEPVKKVKVGNPSSITQAPDGQIFVGNFETSSPFRLTEAGTEPLPPQGPEYGGVLTLTMSPARELYVGTYGYSHKNNLRGQIEVFTNGVMHVRNLLWDRRGGLWTGNHEELLYTGTNGITTRFRRGQGLPDGAVSALVEDRDGAVWVGTSSGLCRIEGNRVEALSLQAGLRVQHVRALYLDSEGLLWVGTIRGGLSAWQRNERRFATLRTEHGLLDDTVQQIVEDAHSDLWLGTDSGLMRLRRRDLHEWLAGRQHRVNGSVIARDEGLFPSNCGTGLQPSALRAADGRLWFCSSAFDIAIVDPERIQPKLTPPRVYIEAVAIDGQVTEFFGDRAGTNASPVQSLKRLPGLVVPPGGRQVKITYVGLDLDAPSRVRYRTRLIGREEDWDDAGSRREAIFQFLAPGDYEFQVAACNGDAVWNDVGDRVHLKVQPKFWQTATFKAAISLAILASAWGWYRKRMGRMERLRDAQEAFSRQLIDAQEAERKRVAGELHDSLGQNLLVVKNLALLGINAHGANPDTAQQFDEISQAAAQALSEVRSISRSLRPAEIDRLGITKAIGAMLNRLAEVSSLKLSVTLESIDGLLPPEFEINLYRILQEATNNILKHSKAASARVELRREEDQIRLKISDDGQGFDTTQAFSESGRSRGFGLSGMEERARLLGGKLTIVSKPGSGAMLIFKFPLLAGCPQSRKR
jgi:signal transduction histidine kinase/ligand-binding sensor domain-containing protein